MDKMDAHLRQQLSAMMDGELASDEARFLFRRLQHDRDLAGCWERWQVGSAALRGRGIAVLLPADFSQRVALAVARESAETALATEREHAATGTHSPRRWVMWGGGAALAASLALLIVVPRQGAGPAPASGDARVASQASPSNPIPQPATPAAKHSGDPTAPPAAAALATALAVADAPRRAAARRNRVASPNLRRNPSPAPVVEAAIDNGTRIAATETQSLEMPKHVNPFAPQDALPARPWPRAVLPGTETGAFTASYSTGASRTFYPFEPHSLAQPEPQPAEGQPQP